MECRGPGPQRGRQERKGKIAGGRVVMNSFQEDMGFRLVLKGVPLQRGGGRAFWAEEAVGKEKFFVVVVCFLKSVEVTGFSINMSFDYLNANEKWTKAVGLNKQNLLMGLWWHSLSTSRDHLVTCSGTSPDLAQQAAFQPELLRPSWVPHGVGL